MSLIERFSEYVRACFTGLWIESHEHQDAITAIALLWPVVQCADLNSFECNRRLRRGSTSENSRLSSAITTGHWGYPVKFELAT